MTISYSADTSTAGVVTYKIQEISAGGNPTWRKKSSLRRTWRRGEEISRGTTFQSVLYPHNFSDYTNTVWAFEADNPGAAADDFFLPGLAGQPGGLKARVTSASVGAGWDINFGSAADVLTGRDRAALLSHVVSNSVHSPYGGSALNVGPLATLIPADSAALLGDWFYPTPTHIGISADSGRMYVMTAAPATHPRSYIQTQLRQPIIAGITAARQGIGGYLSDDGLRLIEPINHSQPCWIVPGVPLRPLLQFFSGSGYNSAAYGLPSIELSGIYGQASGGGVPNVDLFLTQLKADGTLVSDVLIASVAMTFDSTSGGSDFYALPPTDSGHSTSLAIDTIGWVVSTSINGSFGASAFWHKIPCYVQPHAISSVVDGMGAYLPGWLYDPGA